MKKVIDILMLVICLLMICVPSVLLNQSSVQVAVGENRYLAGMPPLFDENRNINNEFCTEFETWINDNIGFRDTLIGWNAIIQYRLFHNISRGAVYLGKDDDLNFATEEMLRHYQRLDLKPEEELDYIASNYQLLSDIVRKSGSQFYYVQCYDKHSIYPEQFMKHVNQFGDVSRTDQIIESMEERTNINVLSLKACMLSAKDTYEVYSNWGDPTHWCHRGAYMGYLEIMRTINDQNANRYKVLQEEDYNIEVIDGGTMLCGVIHEKDMLENFTLKSPQAKEAPLPAWMSKYTTNEGKRQDYYINPSVDNDTRLLIMGDSYIEDFILKDIAESFADTVMIGTSLQTVTDMDTILEVYRPDIVIFECVERADKCYVVGEYANQKRSQQSE